MGAYRVVGRVFGEVEDGVVPRVYVGGDRRVIEAPIFFGGRIVSRLFVVDEDGVLGARVGSIVREVEAPIAERGHVVNRGVAPVVNRGVTPVVNAAIDGARVLLGVGNGGAVVDVVGYAVPIAIRQGVAQDREVGVNLNAATDDDAGDPFADEGLLGVEGADIETKLTLLGFGEEDDGGGKRRRSSLGETFILYDASMGLIDVEEEFLGRDIARCVDGQEHGVGDGR